MTDRDPFDPSSGQAGESPLLFDPNAREDGLPASPADIEPRRPFPVIGLVGAAVVLLSLGGLLVTGRGEVTSDERETSAGANPLPGAGDIVRPLGDSVLTGRPGERLLIAFRVQSPAGAPVVGTRVELTVRSGEGTLETSSVQTDSTGVARAALLLPERPGSTEVGATTAGSSADAASILANVASGAPASVRIARGDRQEAPSGELLDERAYVVVEDDLGNPVPEAEVLFEVLEGGGLTAPSRTRTDSAGVASALWRMGTMEGRQRLLAEVPSARVGVTFTATSLNPVAASEEEERIERRTVDVVRTTRALGGAHTCAIASGTLRCRGSNDRGQSGGQTADHFVSITAGAAHTCGLDAAGVASCWGGNERGQLGDGSRADRSDPTAVQTELRFSRIVAGAAHTCGIAGGGVPFCWGLNVNGQLGDGSRNDQTTPRTVGGGLRFSTLTAGWNHTCGLTSNGNAFCWGLNNEGQLGDGARLDRLVPQLVLGAVDRLVAGSAHTCGLSEGTVLCWGGNTFGQLGDGTREDRAQPTRVVDLPATAVDVAAGAVHACALVRGGTAYCWGQNLSGQLGDGTTESRDRPVAVSGGLTFTEIHAGGAQTCAVTDGGVEYCWGLNQSGQLGDGTRTNRATPTRVGS